MRETSSFRVSDRILFGAAYYPEYLAVDRVDEDCPAHGRSGLHPDPGRGVRVDDVGASGWRVRTRLARARARRSVDAGNLGGARDAHLRGAAMAHGQASRDRQRVLDRGARPVGCPSGGRHLASGLSPSCGADHPGGHLALCGSPCRRRVPGRQRAGAPGAPQRPCLRAVQGLADRALRVGRRDQRQVESRPLGAPPRRDR